MLSTRVDTFSSLWGIINTVASGGRGRFEPFTASSVETCEFLFRGLSESPRLERTWRRKCRAGSARNLDHGTKKFSRLTRDGRKWRDCRGRDILRTAGNKVVRWSSFPSRSLGISIHLFHARANAVVTNEFGFVSLCGTRFDVSWSA